LKKHREEEERKLEELKRQNQSEREEREKEFERAQQRYTPILFYFNFVLLHFD
jgi:hypothetical protein